MTETQLLSVLADHRPTDATESAYIQEFRSLLVDTPAPFDRAQLHPGHITASAFVLSPDRARLLLIHHAKLGLWLQPGGHVDPTDADVLAAAQREVLEETRVGTTPAADLVKGLLDVDIHDIPANPRKGEGPHRHFDCRVLLQAADWAFTAGSDALDARWVEVHKVTDAGTDDSVRRAVRKLLEIL